MKKILISTGLMSAIFTIAILGFGNSPTQAASYTKADVAKHNTASDCWVIVNKNVYNLTSFASSHGGGASAIIAVCGKDGTSSFTNGPHSASSLNAINSSMLGALTTNPAPATPGSTPTVAPDPSFVLSSVVITPAVPTLSTGNTLQIVVTSKDQDGIALTDTTTTFASSNDNVAKVNNKTGLVKGLSAGTTIITTTSERLNKIITSYVIITVTGETVVDETPVIEPIPTVVDDDDYEIEYEDSDDEDDDHDEYKNINHKENIERNQNHEDSEDEEDEEDENDD